MHIYLITNKLNGKKYIGKTSRNDIRERWREHKKDGNKLTKSYAKRHSTKPLYRAFNKYGIENFEFSILESGFKTEQELANKEVEFIIKYNSLCPNGYNLEMTNSTRVFSELSSAKLSKSQQGLKKSSKSKSSYLGVWYDGKLIIGSISHRGKEYKKSFSSEIEAAHAYDKMALFLYGSDAKTNFPKVIYDNLDLEDFFKSITTKRQTSSKYKGLSWRKCRNRWVVSYQGRKKHFKSEEEAAKHYDEQLLKDGKPPINFT